MELFLKRHTKKSARAQEQLKQEAEAMELLREKATIMDRRAVDRALLRIAHEIIERNRDMESVALIGIHRRGVPLADDDTDDDLLVASVAAQMLHCQTSQYGAKYNRKMHWHQWRIQMQEYTGI